jgi:hypothetical protein
MSAPQKLHLVTGTSKWMLAAASTSKCAGDKQPVRRGPSLTSPCLATGAMPIRRNTYGDLQVVRDLATSPTPIRRNTYGDLDVTPAPDLLAGLTMPQAAMLRSRCNVTFCPLSCPVLAHACAHRLIATTDSD